MLSPVFVYGQDQIFFSEDWTQDGGEVALFNKNSIDVSMLTNGLYFCKFTLGDKQITRKFIKQ